jgi:hypothetical protein
MTFEDPNHAPKADSTRAYKCSACEHLHVALVDEDGLFIATAVMSIEMLEGLLKLARMSSDEPGQQWLS